jgi:uncharacterized protein YdaU (DUF1376 family)
MSKPWFPFHVGDFVRDTLDMSPEEVGSYVLLICHYWANGSLPADDRRLATIARVPVDKWGSICSCLAAKFDKNWRHKRIDEELAKTEELSLKRAIAGSKALKPNAKSQGAIARQLIKDCSRNSSHNHNYINKKGPMPLTYDHPPEPLSAQALAPWHARGTK